jgi:hypothetical protein
MLSKGMTGADIRKRVNVSSAYISMLKKQMELKQEQEREQEAPPLELTEEMKEMAYDLTQGTGRPKPGEFIETGTSVGTILAERGSRYGNFIDHARITQDLKGVMGEFLLDQGKRLDDDQIEALEMIFHKIGRILNGDPNYADSWIDIAGYAKLVADRLEGKIQ